MRTHALTSYGIGVYHHPQMVMGFAPPHPSQHIMGLPPGAQIYQNPNMPNSPPMNNMNPGQGMYGNNNNGGKIVHRGVIRR
jgi:hypothetical protein